MGRLIDEHDPRGVGILDIFLSSLTRVWVGQKLEYKAALKKASPATRKLMESIMDDANNEVRFELNCWLSQMGARTNEANKRIGFILERTDISAKDRKYWELQYEANNKNRQAWIDLRDLVVYVQYEVDELASWDRPDDNWGDKNIRICPKDPQKPAGLSGYAQGLGEPMTAIALTALIVKVIAIIVVSYVALQGIKVVLDGLATLNGIDTPEQTKDKATAFLACLRSGGKAVGPEKCQKILEKAGLGQTRTPLISANTLIFLGLGIFVYARFIQPNVGNK